jgi:LPXTG-motif cell wall-anchored protein
VGEYFYVGNRAALVLPLSGGAGSRTFIYFGMALILVSFGLILYARKPKER